MNRYKKEKYINQRLLKSGEWSFQVIIRKDGRTITESFNESEYGSVRVAFDNAINYRNRVLSEIRDHKYSPASVMRLKELFDQSEELGNFNAKTRRNHETMFARYIGDMPLDEFTTEFMILALNKMSETCSNDVISRVFSLFKQMDTTAILKQYYFTPRCIAFRPPASKKIKKIRRERLTSVDDLKSVMEKSNSDTVKAVLLTAYYTGMRPGEIFALKKSDIKDGYIYVEKQIGSDKENEGVVRNTKNDGSARKIPISKHLAPVLERIPGPILFPNAHGGYYNSNQFNAVTSGLFRPYNLSLYKCRHLFATTLEYEGVDRVTIDALMGHSPRNSTDIYVHSNTEKMSKAIEKLGDHFAKFSGTIYAR